MRILLIDDDRLILRSITRLLKNAFTVVAVTSAAEALDELTRNTFDAILCDVFMPDLSGPELLAKLSPIDASRVIFISGGPAPSAATGACNPKFLLKPFTRDELFDALHEVCGHQRAS